MGGIAYIRYVLGEGLRVIEGHVDTMLGRGTKGPDHNDHMEADLRPDRLHRGQPHHRKDGKTHVLMADSTGITTTDKGRWIELKWNIKCSFIKLHIRTIQVALGHEL